MSVYCIINCVLIGYHSPKNNVERVYMIHVLDLHKFMYLYR